MLTIKGETSSCPLPNPPPTQTPVHSWTNSLTAASAQLTMSFPVSVIKTPSRRWKGARVTRYCNSNNWQRGHRESTENAYKSRRKRKTQWKHELRLEQAPQDKWRNEREKALGPRWHATRNAPGGWEWRLTKPRTGGRMCRARASLAGPGTRRLAHCTNPGGNHCPFSQIRQWLFC